MKRCSCCMGLMGNSVFCPHCGYDNRKSQEIPYALPPGSVLQGKYLIGNVLGQGGFGITYIGFDMILEVKVAIKEYYISGNASRVGSQNQQVYWMSSPGDMNHFITEARRMAKLDKMPEIAHVRDIFYANQTAYIIMEYVEGVSLNKHLQRTGVMSYEQAVKLMMPVIEALGRVHEKGLVHRDISPDNLMLEPEGKLRVLDLGAAGDLTRNNAQATQMVARRGFSPYEQYLGEEKLGPYTDVYAVCATIYYCCTGKLIPDAMRRMDRYVQSHKSDLDLAPRVPPVAAKVLRRGLALEVKDRIPNMTVLTEQLKQSLEKITATEKKTNSGLGMEKKIKAWSTQINQLKKDLEEELDNDQAQDTVQANPHRKQLPHNPSEPKSEKKLKKEQVVPDPKPKNKTLLPKNTMFLLISAAAMLVLVCCIAVFGGMKKDSQKEELQASPSAYRDAENTQYAPEVQIPVLEIARSMDMEDVVWGTTDIIPVLSEHAPQEIEWSSSDPSVLEVSADGTVKAKGFGTAEISAKYKEQTAICRITVSLKSDVEWTFAEYNNEITITGFKGSLPDILYLPKKIDGKPVTAIGLSSGIVNDLGVFRDCTNLAAVIIPEGIRRISSYTFINCTDLVKVTLPDSVTEIGSQAFQNCTQLTSIDIPDSVTEIGSAAFRGCTNLKNVSIPDSVESISDKAFDVTLWLEEQTDEFVICGDGVLVKFNGDQRNVVIPSTVKAISDAFFGNFNITSVNIPDSVTCIGNSAFEGCVFLTSVNIPDSVTTIGESAFAYCESLTSITIPESVTAVYANAFERCFSLTDITLPDTDILIRAAFQDCTALTEVVFPKSIEWISNDMFSGCTNLKRATISSKCNVGKDAFPAGCSIVYHEAAPDPGYNAEEMYAFSSTDPTGE